MFVLSKDGLPLMPCHPARARALLARGRAAVARHTPFTIRLKDRRRSDAEVFGVELRIDPGSRGTGLALTETRGQTSADGVTVTVRRGLVAIELRHRGPQIHQAMVRRAGYRRRRRSALRYRPPRFLNRVRRRDWLAPSLRHRVESVCSVVDGLRRYAPVVEIHVEENTFDIPALTKGRRTEAPGGKARARSRSGESCAYCGASDVPLVVDHVRARARGGTDRPANLLLTCVPCNQEKAARPVEEFLARRPELLAAVLGRLRSPLSDAAAMNATRAQLLLRLERTDLPVRCWPASLTSANRAAAGLAKSHTLDGLCVGPVGSGTGDAIVRVASPVYVFEATGRGSYARTTPDRFGFPRLVRPRRKRHHGFASGDLVRATVRKGRWAGVWTGRVTVRSTGRHSVATPLGRFNASHEHLLLLQRADGFAYGRRGEVESAA
ncbi:RNA-guided endonuclease IscB [Streptomyces tanashiensis]|uniref:HNH endonuclease n=1 Tax=Streptomyces tanashiensis TaxID=67367 RepID=A0ABY6QYN0_9ACTN|nr:RNA-guided endonuclease IscB [Streptomyces tanashiensis]UZX22432.1 HNH endonuclease [Streptomyces tanashiensis]